MSMNSILVLLTLMLVLVCKTKHAQPIDEIDSHHKSTFFSVLNGYDAPDRRFYVFLFLGVKCKHLCGGTVVAKNLVLTAAHCIKAANVTNCSGGENYTGEEPSIIVYVGDHSRGWHNKERIHGTGIMHPLYNTSHGVHNKYDVAVVKLHQPVSSSRLLPICKEANYSKRTLLAAGMGRIKYGGDWAEVLQEVEVEQFNNKSYVENELKISFAPEMLIFTAASNETVCNGDSGGPLFVVDDNGQPECLYGVTSSSYNNCTGVVVYNKASYYADWIKQFEI